MSDSFRGRPAQRPVATIRTEPVLQWASQLMTKEKKIHSGWLTEVGRDDALDVAMAECGIKEITIKHGNGKFVTHWDIGAAVILPVIEQVDTLQTIKNGPERSGMALGWRLTEDGKNQSFLKMFVFLVPLLEIGYDLPLILTAKSTLTGDICHALWRHYDLIDFAEDARVKAGKPRAGYPYYAFALSLGPGQDVMRGSGVQKDFTPVINNMPDPPTKEWAKAFYVGNIPHYMELVEGKLPEAVEWSVSASRPTTAIAEQSEE